MIDINNIKTTTVDLFVKYSKKLSTFPLVCDNLNIKDEQDKQIVGKILANVLTINHSNKLKYQNKYLNNEQSKFLTFCFESCEYISLVLNQELFHGFSVISSDQIIVILMYQLPKWLQTKKIDLNSFIEDSLEFSKKLNVYTGLDETIIDDASKQQLSASVFPYFSDFYNKHYAKFRDEFIKNPENKKYKFKIKEFFKDTIIDEISDNIFKEIQKNKNTNAEMYDYIKASIKAIHITHVLKSSFEAEEFDFFAMALTWLDFFTKNHTTKDLLKVIVPNN